MTRLAILSAALLAASPPAAVGSEVIDAIEKRLKVCSSAETNITATVPLVVMITGIVFMRETERKTA